MHDSEDVRHHVKVAENAFEDVQREMDTPFIVPAILDAYLLVSKITTDVCESIELPRYFGVDVWFWLD